jgi:hypothetical protein
MGKMPFPVKAALTLRAIIVAFCVASKFDTRKEIGLKNSIFAVSFSPEGLLKVIFPFFTLYDILPNSNSSI